jgi:hypothetical protein
MLQKSGRAMAEAVSSKPHTVEARVRFKADECAFVVGTVALALGQVSFPVVSVLQPIWHRQCRMLIYRHSSYHGRYITLAVESVVK